MYVKLYVWVYVCPVHMVYRVACDVLPIPSHPRLFFCLFFLLLSLLISLATIT